MSLKEGLDLATPAGRLMANVLASVAQYETEVRAERIIAGQAVARAEGAKFGRPKGPGKWIKVTPEQEGTIRQLKAEGTKIAAIARAVGLSRPTIYAVLGRGERSSSERRSKHFWATAVSLRHATAKIWGRAGSLRRAQ